MQIGFYQQLIQVFAIVTAHDPVKLGKEAEAYLSRFLQPLVGESNLYFITHDFHAALEKYNQGLNLKKVSANSVKLMRLSQEISDELSMQERHILIIRLYEFISGLTIDIKQAMEFVNLIAEMLELTEENHQKIHDFCLIRNRKEFACLAIGYSEIYYLLPDISKIEYPSRFVENQIEPFLRHQVIRFKSGKTFDYLNLSAIYAVQKSRFKLSARQLSVNLGDGKQLFHKMDICFKGASIDRKSVV